MSIPLPFRSVLRRLWHPAVLSGLVLGLLAPVALGQVIYTYDNTTSGAVPNNSPTCASVLDRTFTVPASEAFTVGGNGTIAVGVDISHARRRDLRLQLIAPNGTSTALLAADAGTGADLADYRVTFSSNNDSGNVLDDGDADPVAAAGVVRYRRLVGVAVLDTFYSGTSAGTWTLRMCDVRGGAAGTFNSARLTLRNNPASAPSICASTSTFDWGANGDNVAFASANFPPDNITLTQVSNTGEPPTDAAGSPSYFTRTTETGAHFGHYRFQMDTNTDTETSVESALFSFSAPVTGLDFELLDVDWTANSWEDYVRVEATGPSGRIPYQMTFTNPANVSYAGDWGETDLSFASDEDGGNVRFRFTSAVSQVRVTYAQGNEPNDNSSSQFIGIADFGFCTYDWGDAPNSYGTNATSNGPRHNLQNRDLLYIGTIPPDGETNGQPTSGATGDDVSLTNDDAGAITFPAPRLPNQGWQCGTYTTNPDTNEYCVTVTVTNTTGSAAQLVAWIDFNRDGDFTDTGERSLPDLRSVSSTGFTTGNIPNGSSNFQAVLVFTPPTPIPNNSAASFIRTRLTTDPLFFSDGTPPSHLGVMRDGEVVDQAIPINTLPVTLAGFNAVRLSAAQLAVRWTVATEAGTVGYRVLQADAKGDLRTLGDELTLARGVDTLLPQSYEVTVASTADGPLYLEEVSNGGRTERFGPFALGQTHGDSLQFQAVPWASLRSSRASATQQVNATRLNTQRGTGRMAAEVLVSESGVQEIRVADLQSVGLDLTGRTANQLQVRTGDRVLPLQVEPAGALTSSSVIRFMGDAVVDSLYTRTRPYVLEVVAATDTAQWREVSVAPVPGLAADRQHTRFVLNEDRHYSFSAPGADPWYYDTVQRNGGSAERSFLLPVRGLLEGPAGLRLNLWGGIDYPGAEPDHRYAISVNGVVLGEHHFDGVADHEAQWTLPDGLLRDGDNDIRVTLLDTGYPVDILRIESIEVRAMARLDAVAGRAGITPTALNPIFDTLHSGSFENLEPAPVCGSACEQLELRGYASADLLALRVSAGMVEQLVGYTTRTETDGVVVRLRPPALLPQQDGVGDGTRIVVVERTQVRRPALRPAPDPTDPRQGGPAELLVIAPEAYVEALQPLLSARRSEGLSARVVTVAQIYQHYSAGVTDPQAIRSFLGAARSQLGTRYVLLAGGDTYDYLDRLGLGSVSDIPSIYGRTHAVVNHAPLDGLYADLNDDGLPELAVGRLPVRSAAELSAVVARILRPAPAGASPQPVFAAERANAAEGSDYRAELEGLIQTLSPAWQQGSRVYLDEYPSGNAGVAQARDDLFAAIRNGAGLVSYLGHGSPTVWSREQLLQSGQLFGAMTSAGNRGPVITEFGCWGGYFVAPHYQSMVHGWLQGGPAGTPAVFASSGLTEHHSDVRMAATLLPALTTPGVRLGDALLQAKQALQAEPEVSDVLRGMTLFGDPSMRMPN